MRPPRSSCCLSVLDYQHASCVYAGQCLIAQSATQQHAHSRLVCLQRAPCTLVSRQRIRSAASHACCRGTLPSTREFVAHCHAPNMQHLAMPLQLCLHAAEEAFAEPSAPQHTVACTAAGLCSRQAHRDSHWIHWLARRCGQTAWTTGMGPATGRTLPCHILYMRGLPAARLSDTKPSFSTACNCR